MINSESVEDITYKITESRLLLAIPISRITEFQTILNRALNCWSEAKPEWKHLADIVQHGKPLVDYYAQEASTQMRHTEK